jgi:hypothetical protein
MVDNLSLLILNLNNNSGRRRPNPLDSWSELMKKIGLVSLALLVSLSFLSPASAAPVAPFTENFATSASGWTDGVPVGFANFVASGGPDGSGYASLNANTTGSAFDAAKIIFRGQDETNASNLAFVGDWLAGGIIRYSMYVRHNAPVDVPFFVRFAQPDNSPGVTTIDEPVVAPNTWTKLEWYINPNTGKLAAEGPPSFFNMVFNDMGHIQVGIVVPQALANSGSTYTYDIDQVSVSNVPEPASLVFVGVAAVCGLARRRRSAR